MLNISNRGIAINAFLADTLAERVLHESLSRIPTGLRVQTCRAVVPGLLSTLLPAHPLQDRHIQARPIISRTWVSLSRLVRQVPDATDFPVKNGLACLTTAPDFSRLRCEATKANALYLDYRNSLLDNDPHQGALLNILT